MIEIENSEQLQRWLVESGHLGQLSECPRFVFDGQEFEHEMEILRVQYPQGSAEEHEARAALRLLGKQEAAQRNVRTPPSASNGRMGMHESVGTRRMERLLLAVVIALGVIATLLIVPRAHGQSTYARPGRASADYRSLWLRPEAQGLPALLRLTEASQGQPTGVTWYWQQGGTTLHTFAGGVGYVNCSTNISCSYAGNPPTITITGTGGSGSGCIPPGTTANALLFDAGSGACNDAASTTWNSGTSTLSLLAGGTLALTSGTVEVPGTNGQLLYNNSGALGAEDPVVSGPDARGAAQSKNPVAGLGGIDYTTNCSSGPCVQEARVDSSGNQYVAITGNLPAFASTPTVTVGNSSIAVTGTFWQATQPVSWSGQSVSLTGSWPYSGALGSVSVSNFPVTQAVSGTVTANQGSPAALSGFWPVEVTDGTHTMPTGDASARTIHVTADNSSIAVTGTFWQTTQPVSAASLPLPSGAATSADQCGYSGSNCNVNVAQVSGNTVSTAATGVQKVGIVGNAGATVDAATNASAPANGVQPIVLSANALPSAVTPGNTVAPMADKFGRQVVLVSGVRDLVKMAAVQTTSATQTTLLAAQTSQYADLVSLTISTESATACTVAVTDGTNTYKFNVANQQGAGFVFAPPTPVPATSTATAWQVTGCASVTLDYVAQFVLNK